MKKIKNENEEPVIDLQKIQQEYAAAVKRELFLKIVAGDTKFIDKEKLKAGNVSISLEKPLLVVLLSFDNRRKFLSEQDDGMGYMLHKYVLQNIANEIIGRRFTCECIDLNHIQIACLIEIDNKDALKNNIINEIKQCIWDIQNNYREHFNASVSGFIGNVAETPDRLPLTYEQILRLASFRFFYGFGCVLTCEVMQDLKGGFDDLDKEVSHITGFIKTGQLEKLVEAYNVFSQNLNVHTVRNARTAYLYIIFTIYKELEEIKKKSGFEYKFNILSYQRIILEKETIDEINDEFYMLFDDIIKKQQQHRDQKQHMIVDDILEWLHKQYADRDLCLTVIADRYNISVRRVSDIFKEYKSVSISKYLRDYRIRQAAELLETTNFTLDKILKKVGWENEKHFYSVFKKEYGATPNEYRTNFKIKK